MIRPLGSISAKISMAMATTIIAAIAISTALNILRFETVYQDFITRRLQTVLANAGQDVVIGLDFGLSVHAIDNLDEILKRHRDSTSDILSIGVTDCQGKIAAVVGDGSRRLPSAPNTQAGKEWQVFSSEMIAAGKPLIDALGLCAAIVVAEFDAGTYRTIVADTRRDLQATALASLLVLAPLLFAVPRIFRRRKQMLAAMESDLDTILKHAHLGSAPKFGSAGDEADDSLIAAYEAARPALIAALVPDGQKADGKR